MLHIHTMMLLMTMPCETPMISVHPIAGKELGQQVIAQAMAKQAEAPKSDKSEKKKAKQEPMGSKGRNISRKSREHVLGDERERNATVLCRCARQSKCTSCGSPWLGDVCSFYWSSTNICSPIF